MVVLVIKTALLACALQDTHQHNVKHKCVHSHARTMEHVPSILMET